MTNKHNTSANKQTLPCELYIDTYLKTNLEEMHKLVKNDWDMVGLYAGREGSGKTVKAMQDALYLDPKFNLDNIVFNPEQFEQAVNKAPPYSVIMWDESDDLARNWQSTIVQSLTRYFKRIRSKNLFFILVTPTIFDMNKYFVMHRINYSIQVYDKKGRRGFFKFYNRNRIRKLYVDGKKYWDWTKGNPNFTGRFTKLPNNFPINWDEYNKKKDESTKNIIEKDQTPKQIKIKQRRKHLKSLNDFIRRKYNKTWTYEDYATVFKCSSSQIARDFEQTP